jgi:hypothetical protein
MLAGAPPSVKVTLPTPLTGARVSDRNTGLFLPGHVSATSIEAALRSAPGIGPGDFLDDQAPRVGHGERDGRRFTHVALALFEEGGLLLLANTPVPGPEDLEVHLGQALSKAHGAALLLMYDDESGFGGHARFEAGALVSRLAIDGRDMDVVRRDLEGETTLDDLDPSDWVWPLLAEAIEAGAAPLFGSGVRTDDDIAALIASAGASARPEPLRSRDPGVGSQVRRQEPGRGGRLRRLLRRLASKD